MDITCQNNRHDFFFSLFSPSFNILRCIYIAHKPWKPQQCNNVVSFFYNVTLSRLMVFLKQIKREFVLALCLIYTFVYYFLVTSVEI